MLKMVENKINFQASLAHSTSFCRQEDGGGAILSDLMFLDISRVQVPTRIIGRIGSYWLMILSVSMVKSLVC